jgi:hypothetical protein
MTDTGNTPPRRQFFKRAVLAGGAAAATVGVGAIAYADNGELDKDFPDIPENQVELPPNGKSVIVMGGGLAGLQAGVELAARGFKVTVLERSATPGGKLKSWRDKHFGPDHDPNKLDPAFAGYIREHGMHCVWGFYHNLREFLGRYGWPLAPFPDDVSMYNFFDKDGRKSFMPRTSWLRPKAVIVSRLDCYKFCGQFLPVQHWGSFYWPATQPRSAFQAQTQHKHRSRW